ncbi:MAG TPA: YdhR family protein [Burkholderiales bacterium]|nr:YdhR family protein [Burkholderiales bacterium]
MITEIVTFKLPEGSKREDVLANFEMTASVWSQNPDLIRKNYLFDADNNVAGGVYLWRNKAHAEKWHGDEFRARVKQLYGAVPTSQFFETPIVVDNLAGEITTSD